MKEPLIITNEPETEPPTYTVARQIPQPETEHEEPFTKPLEEIPRYIVSPTGSTAGATGDDNKPS